MKLKLSISLLFLTLSLISIQISCNDKYANMLKNAKIRKLKDYKNEQQNIIDTITKLQAQGQTSGGIRVLEDKLITLDREIRKLENSMS